MSTAVIEKPATLAADEPVAPSAPAPLANSAEIAAKLAGTNTRYQYPTCADHPGDCKHASSFHAPAKADLHESLRFFGLTRTIDGSARWVGVSTRARTTLPSRTREDIAACAAVGLTFWSEAGIPNGLWAVDNAQQAHLLKIDRRTNAVAVACMVKHPLDAANHRCQYSGRRESYSVPTALDEIALLLG